VRAVYAVSFGFSAGTRADDVLELAGDWFCRGQAPEEVRTSWEQGRRSYALPEPNHSLEIEVLPSDMGVLWHGAWRHPYAGDSDLYVLSDVEIGVVDSSVTMYLVLRVGWARAKVAPPRFAMRAPRLAGTVVKRFDVRDGQHRLTAEPIILDAGSVPAFIESVLLDPMRTRPVVFCADDPRLMRPNVDPRVLAEQLAGLAQVYTSLYARPGWELERRLGRLACRDGGVRIWWPGLALSDDPYRHLLLTGPALRNWEGPDPASLIFRRISTAAAMNAAPPAHARLRRAGRLAQAAGATDTDAREMLAYALEDNERLGVDLRASEDALEEMALERDELQEKLRLSTQQIEQMQRSFAEALPFSGSGAVSPSGVDEDGHDLELPTVHDAVVAAATRCPHFAFTDRAYESADDSPFECPEDVYDALLKLERLASQWARPGGIGGQDLGQLAAELGLDWKADVSQTARNKHERHYTYTWDGEKRTMGPHVRLGSGSGAGRIARIYLDKFEPADPEQRRLIVAHVGRKLPDTTT
jgi:hypothetical protein